MPCVNKREVQLSQQVNSGIISRRGWFSDSIKFCPNFWTDRPQLFLFNQQKRIRWRVVSVGDLPHLHWAEADHWCPGCGTESVWTGACPTHWAWDPGRTPWSSSSAHWYWHDAWAGPPEAYRTPAWRKVERGRTAWRRGRVQGRGRQEIWQRQVDRENNKG